MSNSRNSTNNDNNRPKRNSSRYFDEIQSRSAPGRLSKELRKALGLDDDMLPIWIYRMRVLGYPPGWCRQAEIEPNLDIIGDDQAKPRDDACEDGEIQPIVYDENATIEYPGYNAAIPKNVKDDWMILGYPPFISSKYEKKEEKKDTQQTSSQSSSKEKSKSSKDSSQVKESDSQVITIGSPDPPGGETIECIDISQDDSEIISEGNGENQSQETESSQKSETEVKLEDETPADTEEKKEEETCLNTEVEQKEETPSEVEVNESLNSHEISTASPSTPPQKRKVTVIQAESTDSYQFKRKKLPDLSKWAEGVTSELLNFENLPNSGTGNLKKIRDILSSYRNRKNEDAQN